MKIDFLGHACFRISGKKIKILIDPYANVAKMKLAKQEADILLISHEHDDHNNTTILKDPASVKIFRNPGEYEVGGVFIRGIDSFHDEDEGTKRGHNTIYVIEMDGLTLCHLGDLGAIPEEDLIEEIGPVDILMIPVGGVYTIDAKQAVEVVNSLEPRLVIPMHAREEGFDYTKEFNSTDDYIGANGAMKVEKLDKLKVAAASMPNEKQIIIFDRVK